MKTKNKLVVAASLAALTLCAPLSSWAKEKKPTSSSSTAVSPTAKSPRAVPYHGKISAVDQTAKTFSIPGKEKARVFTITDATVITKEGNPATMADVVVDEDVRGSYWKRADGSLETKSVKLGLKTEAEMSKSKKKKKDKEDKAEAEPSPKP
jgi:hypothetical protein